MKTGKFLKFTRPSGEVHACLYLEDGLFKAAVYLPGRTGQAPEQTIEGPTEAKVELVFDPPWDRYRLSETARLVLGL